MSWPAVAWALGQRAPSSAAKFLLVVLADSANAGDWLCWPSIAYLSETTQQDRKTVLGNLKGLEEANLIARAGKAGKTGQVNVWRLPVVTAGQPLKSSKSGTASGGAKSAESGTVQMRAKRPETGTASPAETVPLFPGNSTSFPSKEAQKRDTEPVRNLSGTEEEARIRALSASALVAEGVDADVAREFLTLRKTKRAPLTPLAWAGIKAQAAAAGWSLDQVLRKCVERGWRSFEAAWVLGDRAAPRRAAQELLHADETFTGAHP